MSYKQNLIKLLKKEVKSTTPRVFEETVTSNKLNTVGKSKTKNEVLKKKRKKCLKNAQNKYKKSSNEDIIVLSADTDDEKQIITSYSDSDVEINVTISSEAITPSKSEYRKETLPSNLNVDTVYHTDDSAINMNIFSSFENSDNEGFEDVGDLMLSDQKVENELLEEESHVNYYNIKGGKIMVLKNENHLYIHGSFKLSIIYGNLHLLGYKLTPYDDEVEVYSLRGFSYLYMQNIHQGDYRPSDHIIKEELYKRGVSKQDIINIFLKLKPCDTIAVCSQLNNLKLPYIEKHISQILLPAIEDNFPIIKDDINNLNILKSNLLWDNIIQLIDRTSKIMICGGKGVGKSTLLRYMINKLLINFSSVLVIDLDPGQSEFTIPGCVSAVIVKQPVFGPNFTHLQKPERCIFVGSIDVTLEPDMYVKSVIELLKQCDDLAGIPILVNYMGYTQSYGINIASSIITYVSPTILLQINSTQSTKNFSDNLIPKRVKHYSNMFGALDTTNLSYEFINVDSMSDGLTSWQAQGRTTREMCILWYFSEILDDSLALTSKNVPLYRISLDDITLVSGNSKADINKLAIFNANLVSLCTLTSTNNIYNCHGWGIIRGIDHEKLVLITPISEDVLEMVTHVVVGSVTVPPSMLMYEDQNVGLIPYVSLGCISTFNYIPKRSYLPKKNN